MRAARAARLFFLTRPIKFLTFGSVVAVDDVDVSTPFFPTMATVNKNFFWGGELKQNRGVDNEDVI